MKKLILAVLLAWADLADAQPKQREHEVLSERPSGFWTSNKPAEGGAYRWRLLGIGVVLAGAMGIIILRVMRTAREERETRLRGDQQP